LNDLNGFSDFNDSIYPPFHHSSIPAFRFHSSIIPSFHPVRRSPVADPGALNRAVKRNIQRFPDDFMFQLTGEEAERLRCQTGISKRGRGGRRYLPYVFTEQGVAMFTR